MRTEGYTLQCIHCVRLVIVHKISSVVGNVITGHLLKSADPGGNVVQTDAGSSQELLHLQPGETSTAGIPQLESAGNEIGIVM